MEKNEKLTHYSQELRKNATKEEKTLWYQYLRRYPVQFRRQYVFGSYIVDFYCAKAKLVIELDGSQHYEEVGLKKVRSGHSIYSLLAFAFCAFIIRISTGICGVSVKQ